MATTTHLFCVPFPGPGHAVNMFNVATTLATPSLQVHVLVLSHKNALMWQKATGQARNPSLHIEVIDSGRYEDWHPEEPRQLIGMVQSPEFTSGITKAITSIKQQFSSDKVTAIVINGLMLALKSVAAEQNLKYFLLQPTPYYMGRLAAAQKADGTSKPTDEITYKGVGGSDSDVKAILGDAIDLLGPMYHKMFKPTLEAADGQIWSNTNEGLDGEQYLQPHLPHTMRRLTEYFIGPILPPLYERALDDPQALQEQLKTADQNDSCIRFLNAKPEKSVVYVALGSHAQLSIEQALAIINGLRRYSVPWIMLFREGTSKLEEALGEHEDGVITPWAPQLEVLLHPATKCVLSHGGFGTMVEGVYAGQPFITSPVASDQFLDTKVMLHLGICVGTVAVNTMEGVMQRATLEPRWPDDGGQMLEEVFERAFGPSGVKVLQSARLASQALRRRMVEAKQTKGATALGELRKDISQPKVG